MSNHNHFHKQITIQEFCGLITKYYPNHSLKDLVNVAHSQHSIIISENELERILISMRIKVRKNRFYPLEMKHDVCNHYRGNPHLTFNELIEFCREKYKLEIAQSNIATWLGNENIKMKDERANSSSSSSSNSHRLNSPNANCNSSNTTYSSSPTSTSTLNQNTLNLLAPSSSISHIRHYGKKSSNNQNVEASTTTKYDLEIMQLVYNKLIQGNNRVLDRHIKEDLRRINIEIEIEKLQRSFKRYKLTDSLEDVKKGNISFEEYINKVRQSFLQIPPYNIFAQKSMEKSSSSLSRGSNGKRNSNSSSNSPHHPRTSISASSSKQTISTHRQQQHHHHHRHHSNNNINSHTISNNYSSPPSLSVNTYSNDSIKTGYSISQAPISPVSVTSSPHSPCSPYSFPLNMSVNSNNQPQTNNYNLSNSFPINHQFQQQQQQPQYFPNLTLQDFDNNNINPYYFSPPIQYSKNQDDMFNLLDEKPLDEYRLQMPQAFQTSNNDDNNSDQQQENLFDQYINF